MQYATRRYLRGRLAPAALLVAGLVPPLVSQAGSDPVLPADQVTVAGAVSSMMPPWAVAAAAPAWHVPPDLACVDAIACAGLSHPVRTDARITSIAHAASPVSHTPPQSGSASLPSAGMQPVDHPIGELLWEYVIDTSWDNSPKAIAPIRDVNDDGIDDVIICSEDDYVRCFSGASVGYGHVVWEHEIYAGSVYSQKGLALTGDVDADGYDDVAVGAAWGARLIRALSGRTGEEIWTHDTHEYGNGGWVYQVDCRYDYNGDGVLDVLASTGDDSGDTGPKRAYCLDGLTGVSIWECYLAGPAFAVIGVEDFTGDGQPDAVAGASNESETQGKACGIDGADGNIEWTFPTSGSSVWGVEQIDDITDDGIKDVVIGDFSGNIYGLDATSGSAEYSGSRYGMIVRLEKLGDVNGDSHPDIVAGHSNTYARVVDGHTGNIVWSQPVADKAWCVDRIADVSGDGIDDVLVGTLFSQNYCYFLNGVDGSELEALNLGTPVDALAAIPDIVDDGSMEMVAGGRNGYVGCFSGGLDADPCAGQVLGDANCDGAVNGFDIDPFVIALTDQDAWEAAYDCDYFCVNDCNADGAVNGFDIDPFVVLLSGG